MEQNQLLSEVSIVVTRPENQNKSICTQLEQLGANAIAFPCIEIRPEKCQSNLTDHIDLAIFISPNAVEYGFLQFTQLSEKITLNCKVFALGQATAQALQQRGVKSVITPKENADSEGILKLAELQSLQGQSALIVKGVGGRTLIKETLQQRGANVQTWDVYKRRTPRSVDFQVISNKIDLILFTSSESAQNFLTLIPQNMHKPLLDCQTIVGHTRIAEKVTSLGFKNLPIIASSPSDRDMLSAVLKWAHQNGEK